MPQQRHATGFPWSHTHAHTTYPGLQLKPCAHSGLVPKSSRRGRNLQMPACLHVWRGRVRYHSKCLIVDEVLFLASGRSEIRIEVCSFSMFTREVTIFRLRMHKALLLVVNSKLRFFPSSLASYKTAMSTNLLRSLVGGVLVCKNY